MRFPAYPWIVRMSAGDRQALADAIDTLGINASALLAVIHSETGGDEKAPRVKAGLPRGGWIQLTKRANLPPFDTDEKVWAIRDMTIPEQLSQVVVPYYKRQASKLSRDITAGKLYRINFLPDLFSKDLDYKIADSQGDKWARAVYYSNIGFDSRFPRKGFFTWRDVERHVESIAAKDRGWIDVDGNTYLLDEKGNSKVETSAIRGYIVSVNAEWEKTKEAVENAYARFRARKIKSFPFNRDAFVIDYRAFLLWAEEYTGAQYMFPYRNFYLSDDVYDQARAWHAKAKAWYAALQQAVPGTTPPLEVSTPIPSSAAKREAEKEKERGEKPPGSKESPGETLAKGGAAGLTIIALGIAAYMVKDSQSQKGGR